MSAVELHCRESGPSDGAVLLLGSSLGTTHEMWGPALATLERERRIVAFDHRGHGRSPVPAGPYDVADLGGDVVALMDRLGLERVDYAGVSLAGMVGLWLAINAPERIERLVCICSSAHVPPAQAWAARAAAVLEAGTVAVVADAVVGRWFTQEYARRNPEVIAWARGMLAATPPDGYAACCGAIERMDLRGGLAAITVPTLVIAAPDDEAIPPEHSRAIAAAVPGARLEMLGSGAHLAAIECAGEVAALIEAQLRQEARA